jgi:hypothetical protein
MLYRHEYIAGRRMFVLGTQYEPGQVIPDSVLAEIPTNRVDSMKRTRYLVETITAIPEPGEEDFVEVGIVPEAEGMCPQCGEGPFTRLARHITAKHELESVDGN